ncbi:MAG: fasciclin domain-containing protein, partial [Halieaceae bacterium]|nr:fasciclin domain-containing protein [Halieaceae bacterium]
FAPDNAAFARIPAGDLEALLADRDAMVRVLTYHVAVGETRYRDFESGPLPTLQEGESVEIEVESFFHGWFRRVKVDDATITRANIDASNGVIHRINEVLDPDSDSLPTLLELATGDPRFSILAGLLREARYDRALGSDRLALKEA